MDDFGAMLETYSTTEEAPKAAPVAPRGGEPFLSSGDRAWRRALEEGSRVAAHNVLSESPLEAPPGSQDLAVCFLCVDGLPHEAIWRHWAWRCEAEAGVRVKFYAHAHRREAVSSEWLRERLIDDHYATPWGSVELVRASTALFSAAVRDRSFDAEFLALASETCLPLASPAEVALELFGISRKQAPRSWVKAFDAPDNGYALDKQWKKVRPALPPSCTWKAPQWLLLTRAHGRLLARALDVEIKRAAASSLATTDNKKGQKKDGDSTATWRLFSKVTAADELYFPSMLALCGEVRRINKDTIDAPRLLRRRLTWCDWSAGGRSPKTLTNLTADIIRTARSEGCLFARKFPPGAIRDPSHWDDLIALSSPQEKQQEEAPLVLLPSSPPQEEEAKGTANKKRPRIEEKQPEEDD